MSIREFVAIFKNTGIFVATVLYKPNNQNYLFMKVLFFSIFILFFGMSKAQTRVYEGSSSSYSKIICTLNDGKIYKGNSLNYSGILLNISGDHIYEGSSTSYSNILYTVKNGVVYRGNSTSYSNILLTIKDGKIYKGSSTSYSNIITNLQNGKVYQGNSSYSKIDFSIAHPVRLIEFVAIWHVVNYVY